MVEGHTVSLVTLVLGGARSGKSAVGERLAGASGPPVTYVATGPVGDGTDAEWSARVAAHRARRPPGWSTSEVVPGGDLAGVLAGVSATALVDSLTTWVAGFEGFVTPSAGLCDVLVERAALGRATVVVSDEVGLGVHPETEVGRRFRDALGEVNQAVAAVAARVLLVVAGRALELGALPPGDRPS